MRPTRQNPQQAVGQVFEIMQALAQINIALAAQSRAHGIVHTLHRRLGGQTGAHRILHAPQPAAVIGKHPIGFQNRQMFTGMRHVIGCQHAVDIAAQIINCSFKPAHFFVRIVADEFGHFNTRFVQYDMAHGHAVGQPDAGKLPRRFGRQCGLGLRLTARCQHFRKHHGHGLQGFNFFIDKAALGYILHHQNAGHIAAAQNRHTNERFVVFLARFRSVNKPRVGGRVRQIERSGVLGNIADQPLADPQNRLVYRVRIQPFRRA